MKKIERGSLWPKRKENARTEKKEWKKVKETHPSVPVSKEHRADQPCSPVYALSFTVFLTE
ncbi:hypothetical protein CHH55_11930 [Niallia circulans]|nr:hypothetical protein CHH55_11930 [Niallia circulans]